MRQTWSTHSTIVGHTDEKLGDQMIILPGGKDWPRGQQLTNCCRSSEQSYLPQKRHKKVLHPKAAGTEDAWGVPPP